MSNYLQLSNKTRKRIGRPTTKPNGFIQTDPMILWVVILFHQIQYSLCGMYFDFGQTQPKLTHLDPYSCPLGM